MVRDYDRSAREDAPTLSQYRLIKADTSRHIKEEFRDECLFVLVAAGELGLRGGEIAHINQGWVDLNNKAIRVPEHDKCTTSPDWDLCGYCRQQARQSAEDTGKYLQEALEERWKPKVDASARVVPYRWSPELVRMFDRFFSKHNEYPHSRVSINRRIDRVAEATDQIVCAGRRR